MASNTQTARVTVTMDVKQAERQLQVLNDKAGVIRSEIQKIRTLKIQNLASPEDLTRLRDMGKAYREVRKDAKELRIQLGDVRAVIDKISDAPIKAIRDALKTASAQMERMDRSTKAFADKKREVEILRKELERINGTGAKNVSMFDQMGKTIKRLASYVLVYFGFNKAVQGLQAMYNMNIALSDQLSDIEKVTGLSGKALGNLSEQILRIDTRTPVEQLNKLAVAAGKMGYSVEEDVLGLVKAGNIVQVALGEDLGEDAIRNLAKLNDILGVTKSLGVEKALLATGSAINELGQNSTANEGYLVDFAQRMGGIAAQAGLTIQQVLALGSASDQMGQNVEVSATALNKVITTLVSKTGQVAKAIGVTREELQDALSESTWDGLMLVFNKLAGKGGLAGIAPLMGDLGSDGARLNAVISSLTNDTSRLTRELKISTEAFSKGTSVVDEYEKKNNNLAGTVEKIGKNFKRWFIGSGIIDWMLKAAVAVEKWTGSFASADEKFKDSVSTVRNLQRNIEPLIAEYEKLKDTKSADEQERLKSIMQQIAIAIPGAVSEMDKYGQILSINTDRAYAFIEAQKVIMQANNKDLINETKRTIKSLEFEFAMASNRVEQIQKKGTYTERVTTGLGRGQTFSTEYEIVDPKKIAQAQSAMVGLNSELEKQRAILEGLTGEYLDEDLKKIKELQTEIEKTSVVSGETDEERKERVKDALSAIDAYIDKEKTSLIQARVNRQKFRDEEILSETQYNKMLEKIEFEGLEKKMAVGGVPEDKRAEIERQFYDLKLRLFNKTEQDTQKYLEDLEKLYDQFELKGVDRDKRELIRIQQKYNDATILLENSLKKGLISQEKYNELIAALRKKEKEAEDQYFKEKGAKDASIEIKALNQQQSAAELEASQNRISGIYTEQEYKAKLLEIEVEYQNKRLEVSGLTEEQITELKRKNADRQIAILDSSSRRQEQIQRSYENMIKGSLSNVGEAFGELISGEEDAVQAFGNTMIDVLFDVLNQLVNIWTLEMAATAVKTTMKAQAEAMATPDSVLTFGASGALRGALMAGLIGGILAASKSAIKSVIKGGSPKTNTSSSTGNRVVKPGWSVGGDTGDGPVGEVAGVVHRKEYVVPAWQMVDPVSFSYVRALETIRQTRSHENKLRVRSSGYADGGPVQTQVPVVQPQTDPETKAMLIEMRSFLAYMKSNPFRINFSVAKLNETQARMDASRLRGSRK